MHYGNTRLSDYQLSEEDIVLRATAGSPALDRIRRETEKLETAYAKASPKSAKKIKIFVKDSSSNGDLSDRSLSNGTAIVGSDDWGLSQWDKKKEEIYKSERDNARKMLKMLTSSTSYSDCGFSSFIYKIISKQQTDELRVPRSDQAKLLEKNSNGESLEVQEVQFLAMTSQHFNHFLDRQEYQKVVRIIDPEFIRKVVDCDQIEMQVADGIIDTYYQVRRNLRQKRYIYLQRKSKETRENILLKELNAKKVGEQVLEKKLFEIQKKRIFAIIKNIEQQAGRELLLPQDMYKLHSAFKKHKELFVGYRKYLLGPQDRDVSPSTAAKKSLLDRRARRKAQPTIVSTADSPEKRTVRVAAFASRHPQSQILFETQLLDVIKPQTSNGFRHTTSRQLDEQAPVFVRSYSTGPKKIRAIMRITPKSQWKKRTAEVLSQFLKDLKHSEETKRAFSLERSTSAGKSINEASPSNARGGRILLSDLKRGSLV